MTVAVIGSELSNDARDHHIQVTECGDASLGAGRLIEDGRGRGEKKVLCVYVCVWQNQQIYTQTTDTLVMKFSEAIHYPNLNYPKFIMN